MFNTAKIIGGIAGLGLFLGMGSGGAIADTIHKNHSMETETKTQFRPIEQPLSNKVLVTLGGIGLISVELWWFLFSKPQLKKATASSGVQEVTVMVDGGYEPNRIAVQVGQPVRLNFHRQDPSSCLEKVVLPDFKIAADLPVHGVTSVEFTPKKAGTYGFSCGMNMFRGEIIVEDESLASAIEAHPQDETILKAQALEISP